MKEKILKYSTDDKHTTIKSGHSICARISKREKDFELVLYPAKIGFWYSSFEQCLEKVRNGHEEYLNMFSVDERIKVKIEGK